MAALRILAFMVFAGVCGSRSLDCTYFGLLEHLNLTTSNAALEMMRPVKNWTTPTAVDLEMVLYGILGVIPVSCIAAAHLRLSPPSISLQSSVLTQRKSFSAALNSMEFGNIPDEKSQTVTSHIWVTMSWTNEFLTWNCSDFCGINEVSVPRSKLWIPAVVIQQDASDSGSIHEDPWVVLHPNGSTFKFTRQRLTFTCRFNLHKFPFDVQRCNITFVFMGADVKSLLLRSAKDDSMLMRLSEQFMVTQGEWGLKNMEFLHDRVTNGQRHHSTLVYIVTLERKAFLYIINFVIPLVYLLVLDLASFFISVDSGEKFGFKVTVLLSISVLLLILKDILPSTELDLPIIANLCVAVFTLVWLSVLESMLVSFLFKLDDCCDREGKSCTTGKVYMKKGTKVQKEADEENAQVKPEQSVLPLDQLGDVDLLKQILDEVKAARLEAGSQRKPGCYRRVATVIDRLFFIGYLITFAAFVMYICVGWIEL